MGKVEADDWNPEKIKKDKAASQRAKRGESKGRTRQRLNRKGVFDASVFIEMQFHFSFMIFLLIMFVTVSCPIDAI